MPRVAYLVSQYPTLSHTFVFREIAGLRRLGMEIGVASILWPDRGVDKLTAAEKAEYDHCYYVRADLKRWPLIHLRTLFANPGGYFKGLSLALRCSGANLILLLRNLRYFGEAVAVGVWARAGGYTHLHTHFASVPAMLMNAVVGIPFSMTLHGPDEFTDPVGLSVAEKMKYAALAIAISHYGASQIMRFSDGADWPKVRTVRLGIDAAEFPLPEARNAGRFRIVSVGRLAKVKAHVMLLRAFAVVYARFPDTELTIVGAGPELPALQQLARELAIPVEFTGGLSNELVRDRVAASHCFALASFAEGVPVVLMEAMALGVPCVATRVMGVPELIEHGREGLLVAPGDPEEMAEAICRLIAEPELAQKLKQAARAKVLRDYELTQNIRQLAEEFRRYLPGSA